MRDVEKGLLWAIVHTPATLIPVLEMLETADIEGLRSQAILEKARDVCSQGPEELPSALMERLTDQEAQLLSKVASEREPPGDTETCAQTLKYARIERELAGIQGEIDQMRRTERPAGTLDQLLKRKKELRSQLELARRGPKDVYNK